MTDTNHQTPELLPCPFCGGEASLDRLPGDDFAAACHGDPCPLPCVISCDPEEVVQVWNTRAPTAEEERLRQRVAELERERDEALKALETEVQAARNEALEDAAVACDRLWETADDASPCCEEAASAAAAECAYQIRRIRGPEWPPDAQLGRGPALEKRARDES